MIHGDVRGAGKLSSSRDSVTVGTVTVLRSTMNSSGAVAPGRSTRSVTRVPSAPLILAPTSSSARPAKVRAVGRDDAVVRADSGLVGAASGVDSFDGDGAVHRLHEDADAGEKLIGAPVLFGEVGAVEVFAVPVERGGRSGGGVAADLVEPGLVGVDETRVDEAHDLADAEPFGEEFRRKKHPRGRILRDRAGHERRRSGDQGDQGGAAFRLEAGHGGRQWAKG